MDPFSLISGLAGLISLAGEVVTKCYHYGCAVSGAPEESRRLVSEILGLTGILAGVQSIAKQNDLLKYQLERPLQDCWGLLETLSRRLQKQSPNSARSGRLLNRLLWPLRKTETEELIKAVEQRKTSLSLALSTLSV
jgi:hypothetical protein